MNKLPSCTPSGNGRGGTVGNGGYTTPHKANVRSNMHESFPCVVGAEAQRIQAEVDEVVKRLIHEQAPSSAAPAPTLWYPHPTYPDIQVSSSGLFRITSTITAATFNLNDVSAAFIFFHIHTHGPQILQSLLFAQLERVKILALLPASCSGSLTSSKDGCVTGSRESHESEGNGSGTDSSIVKMTWAEKKRPAREFVVAQRTGRYRYPSPGASNSCEGSPHLEGDFVYYLATSFKNPHLIPSLLPALSQEAGPPSPVVAPPSPLTKAHAAFPLFALLVGPSTAQNALTLSVILAPGILCQDSSLLPFLRSCLVAMGHYLIDTFSAHRSLNLALPDPSVALISPSATQHRILLRMPDTPSTSLPSPFLPSPSSSSPSSLPPPTYRLVTISYLPSSAGTFLLHGWASKDQSLFPSSYVQKTLHHAFLPGIWRKIRVVISAETKELSLVWRGLRKGKLHRYRVHVRAIPASALSRTLTYLHCLAYLPRVLMGKEETKDKVMTTRTFSLTRPAALVTVIRYPQHMREALFPLATLLPASFSSATSIAAFPVKPASFFPSLSSLPRALRRTSSITTSTPPSLPSSSCFPSSTTTSPLTRPPLSSSLSALLLPYLIPAPNPLLALLDPLFPLAMALGPYAFLYHALHFYPEAALALEELSFPALAVGLGVVHLALSLALQALTTSKLQVYLNLVSLECVVLSQDLWARVLFTLHFLASAGLTMIGALLAQVLAWEGGREGGRAGGREVGREGAVGSAWKSWGGYHRSVQCSSEERSPHAWLTMYLHSFQVDRASEAKLLLIGWMTAVAVMGAGGVGMWHWITGCNRGLNKQLVTILDRARVVAPRLALSTSARSLAGRQGGTGRGEGRDRGEEREGNRRGALSLVGERSSSLGQSGRPSMSGQPLMDAGSRHATPKSAPVVLKSVANQPLWEGQVGPHRNKAGNGVGGGPGAWSVAHGERDGTRTGPGGGRRGGLGLASSPSSASSLPPDGTAAIPPASPLSSLGTEVTSKEGAREEDAMTQNIPRAAGNAEITAGHTTAADPARRLSTSAGVKFQPPAFYGRVVEPDYERDMGQKTLERGLVKSGMVQEKRPSGTGWARRKCWKDVYLVVDAGAVTVYRQRADSSAVLHRLPVAEVGTQKIVGGDKQDAGMILTCGGESVELQCPAGEGEVDKWLSVLQWNAEVALRRA